MVTNLVKKHGFFLYTLLCRGNKKTCEPLFFKDSQAVAPIGLEPMTLRV